jgi:hypothetical protein
VDTSPEQFARAWLRAWCEPECLAHC